MAKYDSEDIMNPNPKKHEPWTTDVRLKCNRCGKIIDKGESFFPHDCCCPNIRYGRAFSTGTFSIIEE